MATTITNKMESKHPTNEAAEVVDEETIIATTTTKPEKTSQLKRAMKPTLENPEISTTAKVVITTTAGVVVKEAQEEEDSVVVVILSRMRLLDP